MQDRSSPHYTAFLSYAHKDEVWATWLHTKLEQFKIDADLVGTQTARGPVPKNLRPIFLDRGNFAGGDSLAEATLMALDGSAALIVLCSTISAQRPIVNEEVRLFKERHPDRPIIPVLIDGTPPGNFPQALRYELEPDGTISNRELTVLGPDLRDSADGKQLGLAKVVAGLLGFSNADDIYRRAERHRIKQQRIRRGLATAAVLLVTLGGYFGWANLQKHLLISRAEEAAAKYADITAGTGSAEGADRLRALIVQIAEGAATDPRKARVIRLLNDDKPEEASELLEEIAQDAEKRIKAQMRGVADAFQQFGTIAGLADPERARKAYSRALTYDPEDRDSLYGRGWLNFLASYLTAAKNDLESLLTLSSKEDHKEHRYLALVRLGEVAKSRGNLKVANAHQKEALEIAEAQTDTDNAASPWPRYKSFSLEKLGDLLVEERKNTQAAANYTSSLEIRRKLHDKSPEDKTKRRELAVALEKLGDVSRLSGNLTKASEVYAEAFALRTALVKEEPNKPGWKRALALSHERLGQLHLSQKQHRRAFENYTQALSLRKALVDEYPANATWQRDLSVSHEHLGDAHLKQGAYEEALAAHREALAMRQSLTRQDPLNAVWKRDLAVSESKVGNILCFLGDYETGLPHLKTSQALYETLADPADGQPGSPRAKMDLARHYMAMVGYLEENGSIDEAIALVRKAKAIVLPITQDIDRKDWQQLLRSIDTQLENLGG